MVELVPWPRRSASDSLRRLREVAEAIENRMAISIVPKRFGSGWNWRTGVGQELARARPEMVSLRAKVVVIVLKRLDFPSIRF